MKLMKENNSVILTSDGGETITISANEQVTIRVPWRHGQSSFEIPLSQLELLITTAKSLLKLKER